MHYAELSNVFSVNPYYVEPEKEAEQVAKPVAPEPMVAQKEMLTCGDYESHVNRCHHCMYVQAKKRSNFVNLMIIFALAWLVFKK